MHGSHFTPPGVVWFSLACWDFAVNVHSFLTDNHEMLDLLWTSVFDHSLKTRKMNSLLKFGALCQHVCMPSHPSMKGPFSNNVGMKKAFIVNLDCSSPDQEPLLWESLQTNQCVHTSCFHASRTQHSDMAQMLTGLLCYPNHVSQRRHTPLSSLPKFL